MSNHNVTTYRLICDASSGPGDRVRRFVKAAPAKPKTLTPTQERMAAMFDGERLGFVSKVLVYDKALDCLSLPERSAFASLIKGGVLVAEEVAGGIPDAPSHRVGAHECIHYVLRRVPPI